MLLVACSSAQSANSQSDADTYREQNTALSKRLTATMKDAEFLSEANKAGLDIDPASVEEVDALLKRFAAFPPEVFRKAQEAIGR